MTETSRKRSSDDIDKIWSRLLLCIYIHLFHPVLIRTYVLLHLTKNPYLWSRKFSWNGENSWFFPLSDLLAWLQPLTYVLMKNFFPCLKYDLYKILFILKIKIVHFLKFNLKGHSRLHIVTFFILGKGLLIFFTL